MEDDALTARRWIARCNDAVTLVYGDISNLDMTPFPRDPVVFIAPKTTAHGPRSHNKREVPKTG